MIESLEIETKEDVFFKLLAEHYPEMFQSLFDAVGTVTARSHGMNIKSIFKKKAKKQDYRFVTLPTGEIVKIKN